MLALLRQHGDVIEADLQRHYGTALGGLWTGDLTLRRLRVLLDHLPADSAAAHAVAGTHPDLAGWSLADALLGRLVDEVAAGRWQWETAHSRNGRPQRPAPQSVLPRPRTPAGVIPIVSAHRLGGFVNDLEREGA